MFVPQPVPVHQFAAVAKVLELVEKLEMVEA